MQKIIAPVDYQPRPYQLNTWAALDKGIRKILEINCRRAGKDLDMFCYTVKDMFVNPGVYWLLYPLKTQAKDIMWDGDTGPPTNRRRLSYIPGFDLSHGLGPIGSKKNPIRKVDEANLIIYLKNGSMLRFLSFADITRLVGTNPRGIGISEYATDEQAEKARKFLEPIVDQNGGWLRLNTTPRGHNFAKELYDRVSNLDWWYTARVQCLHPEQEGFYPCLAYIYEPKTHWDEAVKENMNRIERKRAEGYPEWLLEQEYGASFDANMEGSIYGSFIEAAYNEGRVGDFPYNSNYPVYTFWDLGFNDPTAIWFAQYKDDKIFLIDYLEVTEKHIPAVVEHLKNKPYRYAEHYLPHDGINRTGHPENRLELLEKTLHSYGLGNRVFHVKRPKIKQDGIDVVIPRFPRYYFNESTCLQGIQTLRRVTQEVTSIGSGTVRIIKNGAQHCGDALQTEAFADVVPMEGFFNSREVIYERYDDYDPRFDSGR